MADNQDELVAEFAEITGALPEEARNYLTANSWDISAATTEYFTALDEDGGEDDGGPSGSSNPPGQAEPYTGPRTLDGRPAPESVSTAAASSSSAQAKRKGFATLGSLGSASAGGHGHAHDDDDDISDDDDDEEQPRDLFAGGEKSGLAVQDPSKKSNDPKKLVNEILKKARANAERAGGESAATAPSQFRGTGVKLGDDSTPSQPVSDPRPRAAQAEHVTRTLHIWEEGFSIEDGELRRFDDPRHARDLQMIQQGRAPLHLMGVRPDQPVDVQLIQHNEKYKPIPKAYKPFSGSGQRLGSPTPGASSASTEPAPISAPAAAPATPQEPEIDTSQPTVALRLQLANGTRLPARFNTSSTIGDVYDFIERASPSGQRDWVLATTFPNKDHTDKSLQLGEVAEFKRGGTAVQKWT